MKKWGLTYSPLAKSKALAHGFLLFAFVLFVFAKRLDNGAAIWGYIIAFAEAAMVGAFADWFAVTALFRHPLGLPLPHTAIIPKHKARIASNLGDFICDHFLSTAQVMQKITQLQLPRRLMRWLAIRKNADVFASYSVLFAQHSLTALRDERAHAFIHKAVIEQLRKVNFSLLAAKVMQLLMADQRHQELLNQTLTKISELIKTPETQALIAEKISQEVKRSLYLQKISNYIGDWGTEKIVRIIAEEVEAIAADPHHPLRYSFNAYVQTFIARLQKDPAFIAKAQQLQQNLLDNPVLLRYVTDVWADILDNIEHELQAEDSLLKTKLSKGLQHFAKHALTDTALQQLLNEKIEQVAPALVTTYRVRIARYIEDRVNAWEEKELVYQLEHAIGKDLQFIRINGTVVGGAIGLLIHFIGQVI